MGSEWRTTILGNVLELKRGYDLPKQKRTSGKIPIISSAGVSDFHSESKVKGPGVVTGRYGTIGEVFFSSDDFWPLNTSLYVKDFKGNFPKYIYYFLKTIRYQDYTDKAAVPGINRNHLHMAEVTLPSSVIEQEAIAHILGSLDDKIELIWRMNATLEGMAQALFKSWFVDFDPVIDNAIKAGNPIPEELAERAEVRRQALADGTANREAAKQFPAAFQLTEELGWVPEGWEVLCLYDLANFINGAAYKESDFTNDTDALPVVKIAEIKIGISGQTKFTHVIKDEKYRISDGEILLSWSGNPDTSIDTFVWTDGEGWLNQHIFKVSLKAEAERFFVFYQLKFLRSTFAEIARDKQTTGLGHFTGADMKRLLIFKPSTEVLTEFNKTAASLYQRYYQNRLTEKTLTKIRDTLLPKLISGELRIPKAEKLTEEALA